MFLCEVGQDLGSKVSSFEILQISVSSLGCVAYYGCPLNCGSDFAYMIILAKLLIID